MVNLASNARAAEVIVQSGLFPPIMLRVMKHRDPLLCKVIRNVASHSGVLEQMCEVLDTEGVRMAKWMNEFVRMAVCSVDHPDFLVEVLGTLANVTLEEASSLQSAPKLRSFCYLYWIPARPQFFWALRLEDVPHLEVRPRSPSPSNDPTSWIRNRHQEGCGRVCASYLEDDRGITCPVERALRKPLLGRPQSAPQIFQARENLRQQKQRNLKVSRLHCQPTSTTSCEAAAEMAKRLGYAKSRFPKQESDLPEVLEHMKKLLAEQKALMQKPLESQEVQLTKHKDVCELKFPENGARLLANRWRKGHSEQPLLDGAKRRRQELIREDIRQLRTSHKGKSNEGVIEIEIYGQAC
eukprot:g15879.t1